ncbi:hypothetical protein Tco_0625474 [Tanacetum coccineum]|uniref:Uncharacterized protein n=1 Tax=Tanacetum coccineum TaxID=301880 RepID=A0ABQ4WGV5_9ASTR
MDVDGSLNAKGDKNKKKIRHDHQDPPANADKDTKKRKRKDSNTSSTKKGEGWMDEELVQYDAMDAEDMTHDDVAPNQDMSKWFKQDAIFNDLVNAKKDPKKFDDMMGSTIDFTKFAKNCLKKDKFTKAYLIDWANLKGDRCPYDLSKPLPLQGPPGRTTILVDFLFNKDLEYLKTRN